MKRYKVTVKEKPPGKRLLHESEEHATTEKQVKLKYRIKFPFAVIKAIRLRKSPGVQLDLEDVINDVMSEEGRLEDGY